MTDSNTTIATMENFIFGFTDYILFIMMLFVSGGIGVYFGCFSKSKNTPEEYLMGSRKLKTIPVAISLIASQLSAISMLAVPAENYTFGITYIFFPLSVIFVMPLLCHVIAPVFYENNLSNCYEYLEARFNKRTRQLVTASFILNAFLMLPVYMFLPSLAFSQVTGINIHFINIIVSSICVFYTILGGIKAVVWTDVVQGSIMLGSVILVGILGITKVGGVGQVYELAAQGGRLDLNFSLDPRVRTTAWNAFLGGAFMWTGQMSLNQVCVQRLVSLSSIHNARRALYITSIGVLIIVGINSIIGVIMYAYYHGCDPLLTGHVNKPDKMLPFFMQDVIGHLKGMPGIFISSVFSAALSTLSAVLNSLSGVVYFDYIKPFMKHTDTKANFIMKIFIFFMGIYCVAGGLFVEQFNSVMQSITTIIGITTGPVVGVFLLGMFVPRVNGNVALVSFTFSIAIMIWLVAMSQLLFQAGVIRYDVLPTNIDECDALGLPAVIKSLTTTTTTAIPMMTHTAEIPKITTAFESNRDFSIFEIAFYWYNFLGAAILWLIAIPLSYVWKRNDDEKCDPKLYSPFMKKLLSHKTIQMEQIPFRRSNPEDFRTKGIPRIELANKKNSKDNTF